MYEFKYNIHDAVWYGDYIGRVEDHAIDIKGREVYLIQLTNHRYFWVEVNELQEYIG